VLYLEARIDGRTARWPIEHGTCMVGRDADCAIVVPDRSISGRHLRLEVRGRSLHVEDLGSTNGLWVDGQRVQAATVRPDDWFVAGRVLLALREGISLGMSPASAPRKGAAGAPARRDDTPPVEFRAGDPTRLAVREDALLELADLLSSSEDRDELAASLLARLALVGGSAGVAVLQGSPGSWSAIAAWGQALPQEVERLVDAAVPKGEAVAGHEALVMPFTGSEPRAILCAFPWDVAAADDPLARTLASILRWVLLPAMVDRPIEAVARTVQGRGVSDLPEFIFASDACRRLLEEIDRLATTNLAVLLVGETGTGKELLARRIHALSRRLDGPFVAINCSAVPSELLEAELFGIERGVATGVTGRAGRLMQASGGTLLLDEIGDLPAALQPKLLRALESGEVLPVGAPSAVPVDVRIVAATHRDLHAEAEKGDFRRDLLYRVAGAVVRVPPLRERPEDILPLARAFARQAAAVQGQIFRGIDIVAARLLLGYGWPGNVRELRHAIARAVALADGPVLHASLLPVEIRGRSDVSVGNLMMGIEGTWRDARQQFDRIYFLRLLERCRGNLTEASRLAGLARSNLYRKLEELRLR